VVGLPQLHWMCSDFNVHHRSWDPDGPATLVHASQLLTVAEGGRQALGHPETTGHTHFPVQGNFNPTVIDLIFVPTALSLALEYEIHVDDRGRSDHVFLSVILPGLDSMVPATWWSIRKDSEEETAYKAAVLTTLQPLLGWVGNFPVNIKEFILAISGIFAKVWLDHAKESRLSSHSKGWWTDSCLDTLAEFWAMRSDNWQNYRQAWLSGTSSRSASMKSPPRIGGPGI
jgi:hypothetical protein